MVSANCIAGGEREGGCSKQEEEGWMDEGGKSCGNRCTFFLSFPLHCKTWNLPGKPPFYGFSRFSAALCCLCPLVHLDPAALSAVFTPLPSMLCNSFSLCLLHLTRSHEMNSSPPWAPPRFDVTQHGSVERDRERERKKAELWGFDLSCTILLFLPLCLIITVTHLSVRSQSPRISFPPLVYDNYCSHTYLSSFFFALSFCSFCCSLCTASNLLFYCLCY